MIPNRLHEHHPTQEEVYMRFRRSMIRMLGVGLVLALVSSGGARADVLTQTFSLPLTQTNWDQSTGSFGGANPFVIQQFDGAAHPLNGGPSTLQSVTLTMDYEFDNTLRATHANASTITITAHGDISLSVPNVTTLTGSFDNSGSHTAAASDTFPEVVTVNQKTITGTKDATYTDLATLAKFTGTGTISAPAVATATSSFTTSSGNGFGGSRTLAAVHLTVSYTYVPEPGSFVLMGLGGLGLLIVHRRRTRVSSTPLS